jgi:hypothetical protein
MKLYNIFIITILLVFNGSSRSQVAVCSWNIENFGHSKSDKVITFIANTVKAYDLVCILEVVAGKGGPGAVARLSDELNRMGAHWDYTISGPTVSSSYKTERYAFIWKTSKLKKKGKGWLEKKYNLEIDREPYFTNFEQEGREFTMVAFHAITKSRQPETEIKYFKYLPAEYPGKNLIFAGDFNCPESHSVFNPLKKMGYRPVFTRKKTSLKVECPNSQCMASEYDNIFYDPGRVNFIGSGAIPFFQAFPSFKDAKKVSDHVPIYFHFSLK